MSHMDRIRAEHDHALRVFLHALPDPLATLRDALDRLPEIQERERLWQAAYDLEHDPVCFECGEPLDDKYQCPPCELAHDLAQWEQKNEH